MARKIYIETYGCSSNQMDSQIMAGLLKQEHEITDEEKDADTVILNLCSVKQATEHKEMHRIQELRKTGKKLVLAGCLPETKDLSGAAPEASIISTNHVADIVSVIASNERLVLLGKDKKPKTLLPKVQKGVTRIMEVQSGCGYFCSFCSTKFAKGGQLAYPNRDIVKEIELSLRDGVKEFWLTGQEVAGYNDSGILLPDLLQKICAVEGDFFVRVGMLHPSSTLPILNELIEAYKHPKIFKFLHLPQQSGSDTMLKKMNRKNSVADYEFIVKKIREAIPEITIWTDIIAGHPGETEGEFLETLQFVERNRPDFVNISAYGWREGTTAAKMRQVSSNVKKERTRELTRLVRRLMKERNERWTGWSGTVLVDEYVEAKKNWLGRNYAYKPVVLKGTYKLGNTVNVKITKAEETHLVAQSLPSSSETAAMLRT